MSRKDKLLERFLSRPNDFSWDELASLLESFGYKELAPGLPVIILHVSNAPLAVIINRLYTLSVSPYVLRF